MKLDIVIVYVPRYERSHEIHFVPPVTGIHLAAITPSRYEVRVVHQQTEPVDLETDADLVALSFFSGFADEAYRLADALRARGKKVVAGGPHATFWPDETLEHCDSVVVGEAETVWESMLEDAERGRLAKRYQGSPAALDGLPMPRYDLLSDSFFIRRVVQATRGCPFTCSFCTVPSINPGFRTRPVDEVIRDAAYDDFPHWWQRKVVWFWDDNLTARRPYVKSLLRAMIPLRKWWLTQASLDIVRDKELLDLMEASGCIGIFLGIESLDAGSLAEANKRQNRSEHYAAAIEKLHERGICVMAGFIAGFDHDTPESIVAMADQLYEIGVDVPFLSILTPFKGTALHARMEQEGRILDDRSWAFYNGYNVAFRPEQMSPDELLDAHRALWHRAFSPAYSLRRMLRARRLRTGALMMAATMNGFYGWKRLTGNQPIQAPVSRHSAAGSQTPDIATVGVHDIDLGISIAGRGESEAPAVHRACGAGQSEVSLPS